MDMKSTLIKDTTREERLKIIQEALNCDDSAGCENCSGCGEINMAFVSRMFVRGR